MPEATSQTRGCQNVTSLPRTTMTRLARPLITTVGQGWSITKAHSFQASLTHARPKHEATKEIFFFSRMEAASTLELLTLNSSKILVTVSRHPSMRRHTEL